MGISLGGLISIVVLIGAPALGLYLYIKLFNSPKGERYLKMRNQGPFVPTGDEDRTKDK